MSGVTWLRNQWYQFGWSEELDDVSSLQRTLLATPLIVFRDKDGGLAALRDRCPHRFAPLSAGTVERGRVTCGYHGLAFGADGACVHNPHGPVTSRMRVQAYPVVERHTAIWVWMGDPDQADPSLIPDLAFIDATPARARITGFMPTAADYRLVIDNIMDLSHADYLHPTTLGGIMTGSKARSWEDGDTIVAEWVSLDTAPIPAARAHLPPGANADTWTRVVWSAPGVMVLGTASTPAGVPRTVEDETYTLHNMVPETERSTHYFFCSTRRFLVDDEKFSTFLRGALSQAFTQEDKPMLELQQQRMGDAELWDLDPILLPTDAAAVRVRRKLDQLIDAERATADGRVAASAAGKG